MKELGEFYYADVKWTGHFKRKGEPRCPKCDLPSKVIDRLPFDYTEMMFICRCPNQHSFHVNMS